jgi:cytochrome b involved in lipid metabolism
MNKHSEVLHIPQHTPAYTNEDTLITSVKDKSTTRHIEELPTNRSEHVLYPFVNESLSDDQLPVIPAATITEKQHDRLWLVVDSIVYDCTGFVHEHPGGKVVIESFSGQDCSWQFWRFHNKEHMARHGTQLRVGRTNNVENRFRERPRWVGLRRLWSTVDND